MYGKTKKNRQLGGRLVNIASYDLSRSNAFLSGFDDEHPTFYQYVYMASVNNILHDQELSKVYKTLTRFATFSGGRLVGTDWAP